MFFVLFLLFSVCLLFAKNKEREREGGGEGGGRGRGGGGGGGGFREERESVCVVHVCV